jgi:hypothetical protein
VRHGGDSALDGLLGPTTAAVPPGARKFRPRTGNALTILGPASLVPATVGVVFVITDLMFMPVVAVVDTTLVMAASFAVPWFDLPPLYRTNGGY